MLLEDGQAASDADQAAGAAGARGRAWQGALGGVGFFVCGQGHRGACSSFDARPRRPCPAGGAPSRRTVPTVWRRRSIRAHGLVKTYGQGRAARRVLDGAALDVARGELVAVVGPVGLGQVDAAAPRRRRSTGPRPGRSRSPASASTAASERELTRCAPRRVGFVFQFFHLVARAHGRGERPAARAAAAARRAGAAARGRELIDALGPARRRRPAARTSCPAASSSAWRVARALVNDPPVLLADEPTGNLDAAAGAQVLALLRAAADEGRAVVIVTHEDGRDATAPTACWRLRDGRLEPR